MHSNPPTQPQTHHLTVRDTTGSNATLPTSIPYTIYFNHSFTVLTTSTLNCPIVFAPSTTDYLYYPSSPSTPQKAVARPASHRPSPSGSIFQKHFHGDPHRKYRRRQYGKVESDLTIGQMHRSCKNSFRSSTHKRNCNDSLSSSTHRTTLGAGEIPPT